MMQLDCEVLFTKMFHMQTAEPCHIDLPIATDHWTLATELLPCELTASQTQLSACSKNYKAKGSICVSIFDQWLLWSGSRPAVQT